MSASDRSGAVVDTARDYYNSADADAFYAAIWGGEDIHIGLYDADGISIKDAAIKTVDRLAAAAGALDADSHVLDLGAGYGGAARRLAKHFGCRVTALNLSEVENERNRQLCRSQGLDHLVTVVDGNFEDLPFAQDTFDLAWSQDAILHSARRETVLAEVARVLKPGGRLVFTDPMQADDCPAGVLQPILDRIHLDSLGSPAAYRAMGEAAGLTWAGFDDLTQHLATHYQRVHDELVARETELAGAISASYRSRMRQGLQHWVEGGRAGHLAWGILRFAKPSA